MRARRDASAQSPPAIRLRSSLRSLAISSRLLRWLQQRDVIRDRGTTHVEDAREFGVLDLHALGCLTQQLHGAQHMHRDAGGADRVALGLQAAGRIDRQLAVLLGPAFLGSARALPPW